MGTWGVAIFSDDLAADIRGDWREALLEGLEDAEATERILAGHAAAIEDPDESSVFWIALAAAQMETGRLSADVRDRALAIIDGGQDLDRWRAEGEGHLVAKRAKVLDTLATKLRGPQPKPKKLRTPRPLAVRFEPGDVIRVRAPEADREALLVVVDLHEYPKGNVHPVVEALAWAGGDLPSRGEMERMPTVRTDRLVLPGRGKLRPHMLVLSTHRRDAVFGPHIGEVVERGIRRRPSADYRRGALDIRAPAVTSYMSWPLVVEWVGGTEYAQELDATRRSAKRFWRRRP